MTRLLLHPMRSGPTNTTPGNWTPLQDPDQLLDVRLTEHEDPNRRVGISSIPSPWARLQLFRDAVLDRQHPFHATVLNDILDALEVVLFQSRLAAVKLTTRDINLASLREAATAERRPGIVRFAEALCELAPALPNGANLGQLTLVFNNGRLLFATSPYTLIFTPEARPGLGSIPGYFGLRESANRSVADRPPQLGAYIRDVLLKNMSASAVSGSDEMTALSRLLQEMAERLPVAPAPAVDEAKIYTVPDLPLHSARVGEVWSPLRIKPRRGGLDPKALPLVVDNSGKVEQQRYFPWLDRPAGIKVDANTSRNVLPGTSWVVPWLSPEHHLLADKLVVMDAPFYSERTYGAGADSDLANRVLLPLTPEFFEYFRAEDVPELLRLEVSQAGGALRVLARLTVPTESTPVEVTREYLTHAHEAAFMTLWPGLRSNGTEPEWRDYYLFNFVDGENAAEALNVQVGVGGKLLTSVKSFQRDLSSVVFHFDQPPEFVHVTTRNSTINDPRQAQGVILPKLGVWPVATLDPWKVAIDFGTSNTVVAVDDGSPEPRPLSLTKATRFDLTRLDDEQSRHVADVLDAFFFPSSLDGRPFGTVMLKSLGTPTVGDQAQIPAVTANVPFRGEIRGVSVRAEGRTGGSLSNEVIGDLKWGGGGTDSQRLTKLFVQQILQLVYAEARARGSRTNELDLRWSYPSAFSPTRQLQMTTNWQTLHDTFKSSRLHTPVVSLPGATQQPSIKAPSTSIDESTAAMLYFRTDPAAGDDFSGASPFLKLTADVGGGTTDVAAYANSAIAFRNSILFGGRDLVGSSAAGQGGVGIFGHVYQWAIANHVPENIKRVVDVYPTDHTKFTYLVRHPWFTERQGDLSAQPWFSKVQACVLYFYSAIHYNIGLRLRSVTSDDVYPPDHIFFGGNGSSYLRWLTQFQQWNGSPLQKDLSLLFQSALEAGYGKALSSPLVVSTSSRPKQEVALGLLRATGDPAPAHIQSDPPVGEDILLGKEQPLTLDARDVLSGSTLKEHSELRPRHARPYKDWEIVRFHSAFADGVAKLGKRVDPEWTDIGSKVRQVFNQLDERFFVTKLADAASKQLRDDSTGMVTVFVMEAAASLRELERKLVAES